MKDRKKRKNFDPSCISGHEKQNPYNDSHFGQNDGVSTSIENEKKKLQENRRKKEIKIKREEIEKKMKKKGKKKF